MSFSERFRREAKPTEDLVKKMTLARSRHEPPRKARRLDVQTSVDNVAEWA